jgi:hypothetical protein
MVSPDLQAFEKSLSAAAGSTQCAGCCIERGLSGRSAEHHRTFLKRDVLEPVNVWIFACTLQRPRESARRPGDQLGSRLPRDTGRAADEVADIANSRAGLA